MKKIREITLSNLLSSIPYTPTLEEQILKDLPLNKKFSLKIICEYYKKGKNIMYPVIQRLVEQGILVKSRGNFANRNNVIIFERVK